MRILIHSDDLGVDEESAHDLLDVWEAGALDSFSVLANGPGLAVASERLRRAPDRPARIAVHLNLSEGRSSALPALVSRLTREDGTLRLGFTALLRAWWTSRHVRRELLHEIELEWRAQVEAVREAVAPRPLAAVDSHRHVHMLPFLFPVAAAVARDAGIAEIRISREPFFVAHPLDLVRPHWWANLVKHAVLRGCARSAHRVAQAHGLRAPSALVGVLYTGAMTYERALSGIRAAGGDAEVAFHVGRAAGRGPYADPFYSSPWRAREGREARRLAAQREASGASRS